MSRIRLLTEIFLVAALIAALHIFALIHSWYFHLPWFDVLLHFLGGLLIGLIATAHTFGIWSSTKGVAKKLLGTIAVVLFVSVGWELFEIYVGVPMEKNFVLDTSIDLLMDTLGGVLAACIVRLRIK